MIPAIHNSFYFQRKKDTSEEMPFHPILIPQLIVNPIHNTDQKTFMLI